MGTQTAVTRNKERFKDFFSVRGSRSTISLTALMVLLAGIWTAGQSGEATGLHMRLNLANRAADVAAAFNVLDIRQLSFTADDKNQAKFQWMCAQLRAYAEVSGLGHLYVIGLRDGQIVSGPESSAGNRQPAPPGTVCENPDQQNFDVFETGRPQVWGSFKDKNRVHMTALAPISDPSTGGVLAAVGIETNAAEWKTAVRRAQWVPVWITIALLFALLLSDLILEYFHRHSARRDMRKKHAEPVLCAGFMLLLTLVLATYFNQVERMERFRSFDLLARTEARNNAERMYDFRGMMHELAHYFESSADGVTREEFRSHYAAMSGKNRVDALIWLPAVPDQEANLFTKAVRDGGIPDFSIWQKNNEGLNEPAALRPVYYPVLYIEPPSTDQSALGYDLNSDSQCGAAIQEALNIGDLTFASDAVRFITATNSAPVFFVFLPVQAPSQRGLIAVAVRPERQMTAVTQKNKDLSVCLFQLKQGQEPLFLAGSSDRCGLPCWDDADDGYRITVPVFRFGKAYAFRVVPGPGWLTNHPLHNGRTAFMVGLLLTLLVTSLTALITNRRVVLEKMVEHRTAELKQVEKNLEHLNRQNELILSSTAEGILGLDSQGNHTFVNPSAAKMLGYEIEELIGRPSHSLWHHTKADGALYPKEECNIYAAKDGRVRHASNEVFWRKDGTSFPVEYNNTPVYEHGQATGAVVTFTDITERKQAVDALKSSEERFRDIVQNTSDWIWEMDAQGVLRYVSEKSTGLLGYTPEELIGTTLFSRMHAKQAEATKAFYEERVKDHAPFREYENWVIRKDGTPVCMLSSGIPMFSKDGTFTGYRGTDTDITARKWYEQDINQSMSLLEATLDATADGILVVDGAGKILRFNRKFIEMWKIPREIVAQGSDETALNFVLEQLCEPEQFLAKVQELYRTPEEKSFDILSFHDGRVFERYSQPQRISRDVVGRVWSFHDVTKREQAEALLWASQTKLDLALQSALMGVWQWDVVTDKRTYDRQTCTFLGINPVTFGGTEEELLAVVHPDDRQKIKAALTRTVERHDPYDMEHRVVRPDGSIRHIAARAHLFLDDGDQQLKVTGVCWDITDRKRAEEDLREARAILQAALDHSPAGIAVAEAPDGKLRYVNNAALFIRGGTHEEVVAGVGLDQYVASWKIFELDGVTSLSPDDMPLARAIRYGETNQREFIIRRADGDDRIVFANAAPITDVQGNVTAAIVIFLDITDRRKAEERIHLLANHLQTVREEERKRISRELHDDIGQIFTALKIDLAGMKDGFLGKDDTKERMEDIQKLLSDGIQSVHSLCRQLRPGALDDLSLEDALEGLLDDWKHRNQVECNLCADVDDEALSDEIRTAVFRMTQEALTNVSRYAQASEVEINLVADEKALNVSITDNGRGMEPGAADKPTSFGLLGMRERIETIGGTLCIESAPGKGTHIEATIPLKQNG